MKTKTNNRFITKSNDGKENGFLVPIYNEHEKFYEEGEYPRQVYLTVVNPGMIKGPHLHYIRTGCFTCIKGDVKFVLKMDNEYHEFYSGENYKYQSVMIPKGTPAAIQNISNEPAFILNMPYPAWTPEMDDEHTDDFSDYNFKL